MLCRLASSSSSSSSSSADALKRWREAAAKKTEVPQEVASKVGVEESSEDSGDTDAALQAATAAWEGTGYVSYMEHQRTKGWKD